MSTITRRGGAAVAVGSALALALGLLAATGATADDDQPYTVTVSDPTVTIGDEVDVTVAASSVDDLYAYSLDLGFDPALLEYVGESAATDISGATYEKVSAGSVKVTHTKLGTSPGAAGAVTLVTATFRAIGDGAATVTAGDLTSVTSDVESTTTTTVGSAALAIDLLAAPVATSPVTVAGSARVGSVLTASPGTWNLAGLAFAYQWSAGGVPIAGATQPTYRVAAADAGAPLAVTVKASKADHADGTSTATTGTVAKASTKTVLTVKDRSIKKGRTLRTSVKVSASGAVPAGTLTYTYRGKTVRQKVAVVNGKATVTFRPGATGRHTLRVRFVPAKGFGASTDTVKIRVKKK